MTDLGNKEVFAENLKRYMDDKGVDRPEIAKIAGKSYSNDQKSQTIRDALYFVRMTGCRRGEAIGLQWGDIGEQVHIRGTKNT